MRILVVNAGSSSLKLRLLDDEELVESRDLGKAGDLASVTRSWPKPDAIGHRLVHGGRRFTSSVLIDGDVVAELHALVELAPLHLPPALAGIEVTDELFPEVPAIACFDTAFHANLSRAAATYALPREWQEKWGLRRFGFHGLSHSYASRRAAELFATKLEDLRLVTCHLGAGASLAAVKGGASVDTTMGFTPLEGLVMATRSGSVDPGLILWLQTTQGLSAAEVSDALEHDSGLLGLAGTSDMKEILASQTPAATVAVDVYVHRLCAAISAMTASMEGCDAVVFTGGVGEHAPIVRERALSALVWLGCAIDREANEQTHGDGLISPQDARVAAAVITAREDLEIVREVRTVLGRSEDPSHHGSRKFQAR